MAALRECLIKLGLPVVYDNHLEYPKSVQMLNRWKSEEKIHPHFATQAGIFSDGAIAWVLNWTPTDLSGMNDQLAFVIGVMTSMRAQDIDNILCKNISNVNCTFKTGKHEQPVIPREYLITLQTIKNDRDGKGN
jgi:hypothetical protein